MRGHGKGHVGYFESWSALIFYKPIFSTFLKKIFVNFLQKKRSGEEDQEGTFFLNTLVEQFELHETTKGEEGLDFETMVAQAITFLLGGFDTTANLMMWTSYQLALYPDLQQQIYDEIISHVGPNPENADYESVGKMQLLGQMKKVLKLRKMNSIRIKFRFRAHITGDIAGSLSVQNSKRGCERYLNWGWHQNPKRFSKLPDQFRKFCLIMIPFQVV